MKNGTLPAGLANVTFGDVDVWQTISIPAPITYDTIEITTTDRNYGCDNLRIEPTRLPPSGSNSMPVVALAIALLAAGALLTGRRRSAA